MNKHAEPKDRVTRKKQQGRPATGTDPLVALRLPNEKRQAVLAWAKDQPGQPNLSEAIRRLIDIGLIGGAQITSEKTPAVASNKASQAHEGSQGDQSRPDAPPQGETGTQRPRVLERSTGVVRWAPRISEPKPQQLPETLGVISAMALAPAPPPRAQPVIRHAYDNKRYQMPEDVKAFDEYWTRAERKLGRHLDYEEVVVLFNQDRPACNHFLED